MIPKQKTRITITIPKTLNKYLRKRAEEHNLKLSTLITREIDQYLYEYEDDYPWEKVREEIENDKSKK